ncbi:hypothetical protein ADL26_18080 [Thermoactinomyces vulgaris]|nr:hypothetical protein ADL26_18080 [Thermoactinomyces vulgaris]
MLVGGFDLAQHLDELVLPFLGHVLQLDTVEDEEVRVGEAEPGVDIQRFGLDRRGHAVVLP